MDKFPCAGRGRAQVPKCPTCAKGEVRLTFGEPRASLGTIEALGRMRDLHSRT